MPWPFPKKKELTPEQAAERQKAREKREAWDVAVASRFSLIHIAESTIYRLNKGYYRVGEEVHRLRDKIEYTCATTRFYPDPSELSKWETHVPASSVGVDESQLGQVGVDATLDARQKVRLSIGSESTLQATRAMHRWLSEASQPSSPTTSSPTTGQLPTSAPAPAPAPAPKIGVLNFANAKYPGGGFRDGSQAQEESLARSSTLYPSLVCDTGAQFYVTHRKDQCEGFYSHSMIYSPDVVLMRDDEGNWLPPLQVDILTSCAVNAGIVRKYLHSRKSTDETEIGIVMRERMARILYLFELRGVRNLVLGSFGTGVFQNSVELVASTWADLLLVDDARFRFSFDHITFAILGEGTVNTFKEVFRRFKEGSPVSAAGSAASSSGEVQEPGAGTSPVTNDPETTVSEHSEVSASVPVEGVVVP